MLIFTSHVALHANANTKVCTTLAVEVYSFACTNGPEYQRNDCVWYSTRLVKASSKLPIWAVTLFAAGCELP